MGGTIPDFRHQTVSLASTIDLLVTARNPQLNALLQMDGEALFTTQAVFDQRDRGGWTDVLWGGWLVDGLFWSVSITLTSLAVNSLLRRRHRPVDHGSILNGPPL